MNISIKATNTTLTESIKQAIEEKLSSIENFLKPEDKLHVELQEHVKDSGGQTSRVEVRITPHGQYAESTGSDFYEALDLVIPKIKSQLAKSKDKSVSLRKRVGDKFKSMFFNE
jgi:putative sigma-54 modulation protein